MKSLLRRASRHAGEDRDHASGTAVLEVIDPQGVVVSSRTGTITFVRIPFEPLP